MPAGSTDDLEVSSDGPAPLDPDLATLTSVEAAVDRAAARYGDRVWVRAGDHTRTFTEAAERAGRVAAGLAGRGVRAGDRVAVVATNRIEVADLFVGVSRAGAVGVPLNVYLKGEGLAYQLADAQATAVVVDGDGATALAAVVDALPDLRLAVLLDDRDPPAALSDAAATGSLDVVSFDRLTSDDSPPPAVTADRSTLHTIMYTSGTTGHPKGCMLPHGYYLASSSDGGRFLGYSTDDVVLTALPLYHGFARGALMSSLLYGSTVVVEESFSPAAFLARAREVDATVLQLVGAMAHALLARPASDGDAGAALRMVTCIPLDPDRAAAFTERFGAPVQAAVYGQTETGGIAMAPAGVPVPPGVMGWPAPNFEVRVVDDQDVDVPPGDVGELVVRPRTANSMAQGYWRREADTVRAWRNLWHHTGDLVRQADDGALTFVDRTGDALRRRGENVSSVSVEAALLRHPSIAEVAVHAVASDATEDDIKACVVLAGEATLTPQDVFEVAHANLPYFAVPRYVEVVDSLPRTVTMRVRKHVLRERGVTPQTWDLAALGLTVGREDRRR